MSYTTDDLADIKQKIDAVADGRVVQFKSASGKMVTYSLADLDDLYSIETRIKTELARAGSTRPRSRTRRITTSKGL